MRTTVLFLASIAMGAAHAGTVLESTTTDVRTQKPVETTRIVAQDGGLRIERRSALDPSDRSVVIYAADKLYVVDDRAKAYRVMDRAAMQSVAAARRAEAGKIGADEMTKSGATAARRSAARPKSKLVDTGRSEQAGGYACRVWTESIKGVVVARHCVVPVAKLDGAPDLGASLKSFTAFWKQVGADYPGLQDTARLAQAYDRMKGVPIRTQTFLGGKPQEIVAITTVRPEKVGAAMFQVPQGYEQQNMVREAQAP